MYADRILLQVLDAILVPPCTHKTLATYGVPYTPCGYRKVTERDTEESLIGIARVPAGISRYRFFARSTYERGG